MIKNEFSDRAAAEKMFDAAVDASSQTIAKPNVSGCIYSFVIDFKKFVRKSPVLEDVQAIYVSGICIMAKNSKYGDIYKSKYVKEVKGKFAYSAGSHSSPILYPVKDTQIFVHNFPKEPKLDFSKYDIEFKSHFLSLGCVQQYSR